MMSCISGKRAAVTAVAALAMAAVTAGCGAASGQVNPKGTAATGAATASASASASASAQSTAGAIVAFGGSASFGWGAGGSGYSLADGGQEGDSYPLQLAALTGLKVINASVVSEELTAPSYHEKVTGIARFEAYVKANPGIKAIVVWEGLNDITLGRTAAEIEQGFSQMIAAAKASGVHLFLCTMVPNDWWAGSPKEDIREAVNNWMRQDHGQYGVIDDEQALKGSSDLKMNPLFIAESNAAHPRAGYPHLSAAGYGVMADLVAQALITPKKTVPQVTYPAKKS